MTKILPLPRLSSHKYTDEKIKYIDQSWRWGWD